MIAQGVVVTVLGMTIVFVFLELMVILMQILASIVRKFFREPEETGLPSEHGYEEIAAAIAAVFPRQGNDEIAAAVTAVHVTITSGRGQV